MTFVILATVNSEDAVFNNRVSLEMEEFLGKYAQDRTANLPNSVYIKGFIGKAGLSEKQIEMVRNKPDGLHEYEDLDFHVGIASLPGQSEKLYLFYDTGKLEVHEERLLKAITLMIVFMLFFMVMAVALSYFVAGKAIKPVIALADIVRGSEPATPSTGFSKTFYHDEIGFLAQTLEQYLIRMGQTIQAEKRFASDVSHELRTPVTTIKGAAEVIRRSAKSIDTSIDRPLARIERAVKDMENLIETFLTLSRIREHLPDNETFAVYPVIHEIVEQNAYLLYNKSVEVSVDGQKDQTVSAPPVFFKVVISNLLRNAFQYTSNGEINVEIAEHRIQIKDTGTGMIRENSLTPSEKTDDAVYQGYGIGLSIVQRLCDKAGWNLEIHNRPVGGTSVRLFLGPS